MDKKAKKKDTALREHIKARLTRKPNRVIKRSFIEAAMCNHNIVILLMGMLVLLGILGRSRRCRSSRYAKVHA